MFFKRTAKKRNTHHGSFGMNWTFFRKIFVPFFFCLDCDNRFDEPNVSDGHMRPTKKLKLYICNLLLFCWTLKQAQVSACGIVLRKLNVFLTFFRQNSGEFSKLLIQRNKTLCFIHESPWNQAIPDYWYLELEKMVTAQSRSRE